MHVEVMMEAKNHFPNVVKSRFNSIRGVQGLQSIFRYDIMSAIVQALIRRKQVFTKLNIYIDMM